MSIKKKEAVVADESVRDQDLEALLEAVDAFIPVLNSEFESCKQTYFQKGNVFGER